MNSAAYTDDVNGTIIGGQDTTKVQLVAPNGNVQREKMMYGDDLTETVKLWAAIKISELTEGLDDISQGLVFGDGDWETRIYDR